MLSFSTITKYSEKKYNKKKLIYNKTFKTSKKINVLTNQNIRNKDNFKKKFNIYIDTFYKTLEQENINTTLFLRNIQTLIIDEKNTFEDLIYLNKNVTGIYRPIPNQILILKNNIITSFYHELLHCASTKKISDNEFICGFETNRKNRKYGKGLTEGYTVILENRYFNKNFKQTAYENEKFIVSLLEQLVGKDKMTKFYFEGTPHKLIELMSKDCETKNCFDFFVNLDNIHFKKISRNV